MQRQGLYGGAPKPPYVPGLECAGIVEELGEGVTELEVNIVIITVSFGDCCYRCGIHPMSCALEVVLSFNFSVGSMQKSGVHPLDVNFYL